MKKWQRNRDELVDENRWHVKDFTATGEELLPPSLKTQRNMGIFGCQDALIGSNLTGKFVYKTNIFCKR